MKFIKISRKKILFLLSLSLLFFIFISAIILASYFFPKIQKYSSRYRPNKQNPNKKLNIPTPTKLAEKVAKIKIEQISSNNTPLLDEIISKYTLSFFRNEEIYKMLPDDNFILEHKIVPNFNPPPNFQRLLGLDDYKENYSLRLSDLSNLSNKLTSDELNALFLFLHKRSNEDPLPLIEFNAIKNEIATILLNQQNFPHDFHSHFIAMFYDKTYDNMWRDYCVQFLGQSYDKISDPKLAEIVKNLLFSALNDQDGIPAAALIALANISSLSSQDKAKISKKCIEIIQNENSPESVKITALQIAAKFANKNIPTIAKNIISAPNHSVHLKISAIAALSQYRNPSDTELIRPLLSASDTRIRHAAKTALKTINSNP